MPRRRKPISASIRRRVMSRDHHQCVYCGEPARTLDHVIPHSEGGGDHILNLVAACEGCNNLKGDRGRPSVRKRLLERNERLLEAGHAG